MERISVKFRFVKSIPVCHFIYIKLEGKKNSEHRRNCYNLLNDLSINLVNSNQTYHMIYNICYDLLLDFCCCCCCCYVPTHQIQKEIFTENSSYTEFRCVSATLQVVSELGRPWEGGSRQDDYREETLGWQRKKSLDLRSIYVCNWKAPLGNRMRKKPWR